MPFPFERKHAIINNTFKFVIVRNLSLSQTTFMRYSPRHVTHATHDVDYNVYAQEERKYTFFKALDKFIYQRTLLAVRCICT